MSTSLTDSYRHLGSAYLTRRVTNYPKTSINIGKIGSTLYISYSYTIGDLGGMGVPIQCLSYLWISMIVVL